MPSNITKIVFKPLKGLENKLFITLLRKVGFAARPILGGDCFPNGIRRPVSTLLRKVGFADRIYLCGASINFRRGKRRVSRHFCRWNPPFILLFKLVEILISTKYFFISAAVHL
jgi:hypothetical protein